MAQFALQLAFKRGRLVAKESKAMSQQGSQTENVAKRFTEIFHRSCSVHRAPGRVNLIGEHTDYNDGFVMPVAIDMYTLVGVAPNDDNKLRVYSEQFKELIELELEDLAGGTGKDWSNYVRGVAAEFIKAGFEVSGADLVIDGGVPIGAGLSSSAALEIATAHALASVSGIHLGAMEVAFLCQRAEHNYAGTRCGIMDQFVACFGEAGHALMLDCRSLAFKLLPIPSDVSLVVCNSMVKHELAAGEYNERRASCERTAAALKRHLPHITALRDLSVQDLVRHSSLLDEVDYRRSLHVVTENERVIKAAEALKAGDLEQFGRLMYDSHESLDKNFEVTCLELNTLVEIARGLKGVYGARMTGGGFGGCTVNLVDADAVSDFVNEISGKYRGVTGRLPAVYVTKAAQGAGNIGRSLT